MIKNDRVYGVPLVQYKDTKANIEALSGIGEGAIAYATDSNEFGSYDGTTWTWGQGGSTAPATTAANDFQVGDGAGSWIKKTLAEVKTILGLGTAAYTASTDYQPIDSDLTAIGGLTPSNDDIIQRKAGAWTNRTLAQFVVDIANLFTSYFVYLGGWTAVSGTFTYASASTINTPSDLTGSIQKGMPIRWKQGGGYKYGNVKAITSSLITILANNDYTIANSAITDFYYSSLQQPAGFPESFSFTLGWSSDSNPQPSYGNATLSMWYTVISSGLYAYSAQAIFGSTTTFGTGLWRFSLPSGVTRSTTGNSFGIDVSAPVYVTGATIWDGTTKVLAMIGGGYAQPTFPYTWANGDYLGLSGVAPF